MTRFERALAAGYAVAAAVVLTVYALAPSARPVLVEEDRILEMSTVAALLAGALVAVRAIVVRGRGEAYHRAPAVVVAGLSVTAVLDELSFGARIFGFKPPVVEGASLDAVHDLVLITALFITHHGPVIGALTVLALGAVGLVTAAWFWRSGVLDELRHLRSARILAAGMAIAVATTLIDLDQVAIPALQLWEELLEFGGGLLVLAAALATPADCRLLGQRHVPAAPAPVEATVSPAAS